LKVIVRCLLIYNGSMARGWESKAIEEQLAASEAEREARAEPTLTAEEMDRRARKNSLELSRSRILKDLEAARNENYRALLERTLAHLEAELATFESADMAS
jgi:hypothetical protein